VAVRKTDADVLNAIERQRRGVLSAALRRLRGLASTRARETWAAILTACGHEAPGVLKSGAPGTLYSTKLRRGATSLEAAVWVLPDVATITAEHVAGLREMLPPEVAVAEIMSCGRADAGAIAEAAQGRPPIGIWDGSSVGEVLAANGILVGSQPLPSLLHLSSRAAEAPVAAWRDGRGHAAWLFRWQMERGEDKRFRLRAIYQPDPSLSFSIEGEIVPPGEPFVASRTELHRAICEQLARIFPELTRAEIRTKAWAGAHKVYPVRIYGKHQAEEPAPDE